MLGLILVWQGGWFTVGLAARQDRRWCWCSQRRAWLPVAAVKDFAADRNTQARQFYRIINEVPTVLMIGIVILVIVKPF